MAVAFLGCVHPTLSWPVAAFCYPMIKAFLMVVSLFGTMDRGIWDMNGFTIFGFYVYGLFAYGFYYLLKRKYAKMSVGLISGLLLLALSKLP